MPRVIFKKAYCAYQRESIGSFLRLSFRYVIHKTYLLINHVLEQLFFKFRASSSSLLFTQLFAQAIRDKKDYVPFSTHLPLVNPAKLLAFYMPQFSIPENDQWWSNGLTEWTHVSKAVPQFVGHYQPHLPGELGFYDLRLKEIQKRQIELAKNYGLHGFCYYYYWFSGKKLLSHSLDTVLHDPDLDFPFCLCWTNGDWSKKSDGLDQEILMEPCHNLEDDINFIKEIEPILRDPRYIKIDGRLLLIIHDITLFSDPNASAQCFRKYCIHHGIGDLFLVAAETHCKEYTLPDGFDALVEYPTGAFALNAQAITSQVHLFNQNYKGTIIDYARIVEASCLQNSSPHQRFKTVVPSWDNEAKYPGCSLIFAYAKPELYKTWLKNCIKFSIENNCEPVVFINAWNKWSDGAYLEPDAKYGYAWLQETHTALLESLKENTKRQLVLVIHDMHPFGAQLLALKLVKSLKHDFGYQIELIALGEGSLYPEFQALTSVHVLNGSSPVFMQDVCALMQKLVAQNHKTVIVNSAASGRFTEVVKYFDALHCMVLVHEQASTIKSLRLEESIVTIARYANKVIFPAQQVYEQFLGFSAIPAEKVVIRSQGLIKNNALNHHKDEAKTILRQKLKLDRDAKIILGMGMGCQRKGTDLFVEIGLDLLKKHTKIYFVWVGPSDLFIDEFIKTRLREEERANHFYFEEYTKETDIYFAGADIFALTSREDPFPSVVLQALEVGLPVVGYKGAGGFNEILAKNCGLLVPLGSITDFSNALFHLLNNPDQLKQLGQNGTELIAKDYSFHHYVYDLLSWAKRPLKRVSVIIPNYNYAHYLEQRLSSIIQQSYPIYELIILDDASTDDSIRIINHCLKKTNIKYKLFQNKQNSGSVFKQWQKGIEHAEGDFIWIAEADDYSSVDFLEKLVPAFDNSDVVLSYSQSFQVDSQGQMIATNYEHYTQDICIEKWQKNYINHGMNEIQNALCIKNTIPNVSGAIFRKKNLVNALEAGKEKLKYLRVAGDWLIYYELLTQGKIAFNSESLNYHRRHDKSVASFQNEEHFAEVIYLQQYIKDRIKLESKVQRKVDSYVAQLSVHFKLSPQIVSTGQHYKLLNMLDEGN